MTITKQEKKILIVSQSNNNVIKRVSQWLIQHQNAIVVINTDLDDFSIISLDITTSNFLFKINHVK